MAHEKVERRSLSTQKWAEGLFNQYKKYVIAEEVEIQGWQARSARYAPENYQWLDDFKEIRNDEPWGGPDVTTVFKTKFTIPASLVGKEIWFYMSTSSEVMVKINGKYINGIDPNRQCCLLSSNCKSEEVDFFLEAYTRSKPDDDRNFVTRKLKGCIQVFKTPKLIVINKEVQNLIYKLDIILATAYGDFIAEDIKLNMQYHIDMLIKLFPLYDSEKEELLNNINVLNQYIDENIFNENKRYNKNGKLACVAHSHLDIAYHWKVDQTIQKNARTCLIQLDLMNRYPDFKYAHSQAWTYETLEKYYPEIFKQVKGKIKEGQWEVVGGMYVEPDCNVISAESMARQIIYGQMYFKEKFNLHIDNCWLPDVFGNSPIMPQILKLGGIEYFVSNKMSTWNDTNQFPYNNFIWKGIDGTEVYACVPPVHFITWMDPNQAVEHWNKFQHKGSIDESLQMYGYGDGGSGVTDEMLNHFQLQQNLSGIPSMRLTTGKEYLHSSFKSNSNLSTWDGDLYLEMHRGTFTTNGELKKYNRLCELTAYEIEALATYTNLTNSDYPYPNEQIKDVWKKILLNQFHDILPGSHTSPIYYDAVELYKQALSEFEEIKKQCLTNLKASESEEKEYYIFNPLSDTRNGVAYLENLPHGIASLVSSKGELLPIQKIESFEQTDIYAVDVSEIPPLCFTRFGYGNQEIVAKSFFNATTNLLENDFFKVSIGSKGEIISICDKVHNRELSDGEKCLNNWVLYEDKPGIYNAWDIVKTYKDKTVKLDGWKNIQVVENGPVTAAIKMERKFGNSKAQQIIRVYKNNNRIDFETIVDWYEEEKLLKVEFPVNVKSRIYQTDTSAGVFERMNHQNTTWEQAKFEVPCHKWVSLSEGMFGVAIMNNCKYGCSVEGNTMSLSLLRAPIRPDRESDKGQHQFTYSIYTYGDSWQNGGLVEAALELNSPMKLSFLSTLKSECDTSIVTISNPAVKVQSVKASEDGSCDVVIRLCEFYSSHATITLVTNFFFKKAYICNLLESDLKEITVNSNNITLSFKPYEIKTIRFSL